MTFDGSVNLGQVVEALVFLGGLIIAFFSLKTDVKLISQRENERHVMNTNRLDSIENEMKMQTQILVELSAQKTRLNNVESRIMYLEQKGFGHGG